MNEYILKKAFVGLCEEVHYKKDEKIEYVGKTTKISPSLLIGINFY